MKRTAVLMAAVLLLGFASTISAQQLAAESRQRPTGLAGRGTWTGALDDECFQSGLCS